MSLWQRIKELLYADFITILRRPFDKDCFLRLLVYIAFLSFALSAFWSKPTKIFHDPTPKPNLDKGHYPYSPEKNDPNRPTKEASEKEII